MVKRVIMALIATIGVARAAFAEREVVNGIEWQYRVENGCAVIGNERWPCTPAISAATSGSLVIPSHLGGCPVVRIGEWAICRCCELSSVTIPLTVTNVEDHAFWNCSGLSSVTIPSSVKIVGRWAFSGCDSIRTATVPGWNCGITTIENLEISEDVTCIGDNAFDACFKLSSVTIPSSVTNISGAAFSDCSGLASVVVDSNNACYQSVGGMVLSKDGKTLVVGVQGEVEIPSTVEAIGEYAFSGRRGLNSLTISLNVTSIGEGSFSGCSGLTSLVIPSSVTNIGKCAFVECVGLTAVMIMSGVTTIGDFAFENCNGLVSVTIPSSAISIGNSVFDGCNAIQRVSVPGWQCGIDFAKVTDLVISEGTVKVAESAFSNCCHLTSVSIPSSVTALGAYAFCSCSGLMSVMIPSSVANIGASVFERCVGLASINIPDGVMNIGDSTFKGCTNLATVTLSDRLTNIGDFAFMECCRLTSITIPEGVTNIGVSAFERCVGLDSINVPAGVMNIDDSAFRGCVGLVSIVIPNSVGRIGCSAFACCSALTAVSIPSHVTNIGDSAFEECSGLTSVIIAEGLTSIGPEAFRGCVRLTSIVVPFGVQSIGYRAFRGCSGLTSVTIPASVTSIGHEAFRGCVNLSACQLPTGIRDIGYLAFSGCSGLTGVTIPSSVTSIGSLAFSDCCGLMSFTVESNNAYYQSVNGLLLSKDGKTLVAGVNGDVTIPSSVTKVGDSAFYDCIELTSVTIPDGVTSIGDSAFYGCARLTSVALPVGVMNIGNHAFSCGGLKEIVIPSSVMHIGASAFEECGELKIVWIEAGDVLRIKRMYSWASSVGLKVIGTDPTVDPVSASDGEKNSIQNVVSKGATGAAQRHNSGWQIVDDSELHSKVSITTESASLAEDVVGEPAVTSAALTYDGCLVDSATNSLVGFVSVKAAKAKKNAKTGKTTSKLTISVQLAGSTKKISITGEYDLSAGGVQTFSKNGQSISLKLGANGMTGAFGDYSIEGVPNVFTAKNSDSKATASAAEGATVGVYNVRSDEGTFTLSVAKKGKVKVSGTTAAGVKVSASAQLLVGAEAYCIPVVIPKASLAFAVWLGVPPSVEGLANATVGPAGTLASGAALRFDTEALTALLGEATYAAYLPNGLAVAQSGTKWIVAGGAKAGKVMLAKDGSVDAAKAGANPSGLKLTYTAKTGAFKGSFKAYVSANGKPKGVTVNVVGVMINGVGYGTATIKGKTSVPITIEP